MNKRIKIIRESLDMSRAAFGEKLGISGDVVNNLERGRVEIKDDRIKLICSIFDVDEEWLRTGNGEPHKKRTRNQELMAFTNDIMDDVDESFKKRFLHALSKLNESDWETIEKIVDILSKED